MESAEWSISDKVQQKNFSVFYPLVFLRYSLRELRGQIRADFIIAASWWLLPAASSCLLRSVGRLMQFVFYSEKTLLPHYCLHVMCHNKCSNRCLFCTFLNAFSSWESSYDSLYYPPFCHLECIFNYISLTLPHYYLTLLVYQSFVVYMWGLEQIAFSIFWVLLWDSFSLNYILLLIPFS